jgi:histidyl-tRNA synthetase
MHELRRSGITVGESLGKKSFRLQLKAAEKDGAALALLFGQREVFEGTVILRDMASGAQETVLRANIVEEVRRRVRGI